MLKLLRTLSAGVLGATFAGASPAVAGGGAQCGGFYCEVKADSPAQSAGPISVPRGVGSATAAGAPESCRAGGLKVACQTSLGSWSNSNSCYVAPVRGVPAAAGVDGSLYICSGLGRPGLQSVGFDNAGLLVVDQADAPPPQLVDPRVLAESALERLPLTAPDIQTAPAAPDMSYVSLETWLWMEPGAFEVVTVSASAGPTTVTATARPISARWTTGDGGSTTCTSPGRPWVTGMTDTARTDCSYTWVTPSNSQPGGVFKLTSSLTYEVRWTCSGSCLITNGDLGLVPGPTTAGAIRVGERQSVVVRG